MRNEVSPESPPAYDSVAKDGSGVPLAGEPPAVVPQTEQQQQYTEYCAQQNAAVTPQGAVIIEQQQPTVVVTVPPTNIAPNYCHFCNMHVSCITKESRFKPILR